MNREEYLLIADVLSGINHNEEGEPVTVEVVAAGLAEAFREHDANFNRVQFLTDCAAI